MDLIEELVIAELRGNANNLIRPLVIKQTLSWRFIQTTKRARFHLGT